MKYSSVSTVVVLILLLLSFHSGMNAGEMEAPHLKCRARMRTKDDCLESRCSLACEHTYENGKGKCNPFEQGLCVCTYDCR